MSTEALLERLPHQDLRAEQNVLGCVIIDQDRLDDVALVLTPDDFYSVAHQTIYAAALELHNEGRGVDSSLLISALRKRNELENIGGLVYLAEVIDSVPTAANAVYYAEEVRECSLLRSMAHAGGELLNECYKGDGPARERIARAEAKVLDLLDKGTSKSIRPIRDVLHDAIAEIDDRMERESVAGLTTGYPQLDIMMGGMRPGELIIVAARPSHGKSALAANIVEYVSVHLGRTSLLVSLEMSAQELAERMLSSASGVNGATIRSGAMTKEERQAVVSFSNGIAQSPMFIDDAGKRNMVEIASAARRLKRTNDLSLIVVDYLQLIEPDNRKDSREQQVAVMSRRLKQLSRELKIPVVCLAQLNRENEKGTDHRPKLSHLRESGAIEQDADVVLFVHREDMYRTPDKWNNKAVVIVAKNRNGRRGDVNLEWNPGCTRFDTPSTAFDPDEHQYPGGGWE